MGRSFGAAMIVVVLGACTAVAQSARDAASQAPPDVVKDIAPTGTLRAAINAGNVVLVQMDSAGVEAHGITVDLARELQRRLGVSSRLMIYQTAGRVTDAVKTAAWDIAFVAIEPARAAVIDFTAPYVIIEGTYLVAVDSPLKTTGDVDRAGIRIAVARGSAYDLYLTRTLQHATLVRYPSPPLALAGFMSDKLDVAAGVRQFLVQFAKTNPNVRVMPDHFQEIKEAMGMPRGRHAGLQYLRTFVEEMKATGFVAKALERANQSGAIVAPPAAN